MATLVTCPECDTNLKLAAEPTPGKKVKCPKCETVFVPGAGEERRLSARKPAPPSPLPARRDEPDDEDDDRDRAERRPRRPRPKQGGSAALVIGLLVGVGLLGMLVVCGGVAAYFLFFGVKQGGGGPVAVPEVKAGGGPVVGPGPNGGAAQKAAPPDNAPPGLYGDQGGEEVAPADPGLPDTLLRARADDTFYRVSNVRTGQSRFGRPVLLVDYEVTRAGKNGGASLIIHGDDGSRATVILFGIMQTHGTFDVEQRFGFPGQRGFPANLEVYMVRTDGRYGQPAPTFKVSNSATMGNMTRRTRARNWTPEEIARLTKPPPNYTNANAYPNIGKDTPFAGDTTGGVPMRYLEPKGLLLGLDYRMAEWDHEKCFGGAVPIFSRDQPASPGTARVLAKEGYAVGGIKVRSKRYVDAVQITFFRVKPDGKLDPKDSYTSEWFGDAGDQPVKELAGDGTRVIGIVCRQGAILNGLALVLERPEDAKP